MLYLYSQFVRRIAKTVHLYNLDKKKLGILHANKDSFGVKNKLIKILMFAYIRCISIVIDKLITHDEDLYIFALKKNNSKPLYFRCTQSCCC